jgi:hypothetical protein
MQLGTSGALNRVGAEPSFKLTVCKDVGDIERHIHHDCLAGSTIGGIEDSVESKVSGLGSHKVGKILMYYCMYNYGQVNCTRAITELRITVVSDRDLASLPTT